MYPVATKTEFILQHIFVLLPGIMKSENQRIFLSFIDLIIVCHSLTHSLFNELRTLNIYKFNIFQNLVFIFKTRNGINPDIFSNKVQNIEHKYPTRFSDNNYYVPQTRRNFLRFAISSRAPSLWNKILPRYMKDFDSLPRLKNKLKDFLNEDIENEQQYF